MKEDMIFPARCHCGSSSSEHRYGENRYICAHCKRPLWQPIASAPKDGTTILVYEPVFFQTAAWEANEFKAGWTNASGGWLGDVTYWMPIPEAPKE
jgi:hypothetical protein